MNDYSKWLLVSDIDGTLNDKKMQLPPNNKEAINRFVSNGGVFTLCSGRNLQSLGIHYDKLNIETPAIFLNGAGIYDFKNEKIVCFKPISYEGEKIISEMGDKKIQLTGKEWVSMNLFGFTPKDFERFNLYWENFISANVATEKAEALLPVAASDIIKNKEGIVKFFTSSENWFGMTYPEDREIVKAEIANKIKDGYYPEILWEK